MSSIGSAALVLTTQAAALYDGLDSAVTTIRAWAGKVDGMLGSIFSKSGSAIKDALLAPFGAGGNFIGDAIDRIKKLGDTAKQAKGLGIAADQFQGLGLAADKAGVSQDALIMSMLKMSQHVQKASTDVKHLGGDLAGLGLNAKELAAKPLDQQFLAVADALSRMPAGGTQAAKSMEIFGKASAHLLPLLAQGKEGINKFIEEQKKLGLVISQQDFDSVLAAKMALPKVNAVLDGFKQKLYVAFAPVIEVIGGELKGALSQAVPVLDAAARAIKVYFEVIAFFYQKVVDAVNYNITSIKEWVQAWIGADAKIGTVEENTLLALRHIAIAGAYVWDGFKLGLAGAMRLVGVLGILVGGLIEPFRLLFEGLAKVTPGEKGKDFYEMASAYGVMQLKLEKFYKDSKDAVKDINAGWGKSKDKVNEFFDEFAKRKKDGGGGEGLLPDPPKVENLIDKYHQAAAQLKGSKDAFSTEAKFNFEQKFGEKNDERLAAQKEANKLLEKVIVGVKDMKDAIKDIAKNGGELMVIQ